MSDINKFNEINALVSCTTGQCLYIKDGKKKKKKSALRIKACWTRKSQLSEVIYFSSLINIIYTCILQFSSWPFNCNMICTPQ